MQESIEPDFYRPPEPAWSDIFVHHRAVVAIFSFIIILLILVIVYLLSNREEKMSNPSPSAEKPPPKKEEKELSHEHLVQNTDAQELEQFAEMEEKPADEVAE